MKLYIALLGMILSFNNIQAQESSAYYQIGSSTLTLEDGQEGPLAPIAKERKSRFSFGAKNKVNPELSEFESDLDTIISIGTKIYTIIEKGKPVVTRQDAVWKLLPKVSGQEVDEMDLEGWYSPAFRKYRLELKNLYGVTVVSLLYTINYTYGGQYDGKGRYLTGVEIRPEDLMVRWGYNFDAKATRVSIVNHGSKKNPVVGMTIKLGHTIKTVLNEVQQEYSYHIKGDGSFQAL
ncbi:MAG: hypothetical protein HYV97_09620 [Bdellovibrio sp.]|nr:hypothetical protein [Bdellovibrio sp.]